MILDPTCDIDASAFELTVHFTVFLCCFTRLIRHMLQEHPHATKAGNWRSPVFKSEVFIRPEILLSILNQGYTVLWTDSDMVWLKNPLPFLPGSKDTHSVSGYLW